MRTTWRDRPRGSGTTTSSGHSSSGRCQGSRRIAGSGRLATIRMAMRSTLAGHGTRVERLLASDLPDVEPRPRGGRDLGAVGPGDEVGAAGLGPEEVPARARGEREGAAGGPAGDDEHGLVGVLAEVGDGVVVD